MGGNNIRIGPGALILVWFLVVVVFVLILFTEPSETRDASAPVTCRELRFSDGDPEWVPCEYYVPTPTDYPPDVPTPTPISFRDDPVDTLNYVPEPETRRASANGLVLLNPK